MKISESNRYVEVQLNMPRSGKKSCVCIDGIFTVEENPSLKRTFCAKKFSKMFWFRHISAMKHDGVAVVYFLVVIGQFA